MISEYPERKKGLENPEMTDDDKSRREDHEHVHGTNITRCYKYFEAEKLASSWKSSGSLKIEVERDSYSVWAVVPWGWVRL